MSCKVKSIWYNPAASAFEGRVDVRRGQRSFRYPCTVLGSADMPQSAVRAQMKARALQMSDS